MGCANSELRPKGLGRQDWRITVAIGQQQHPLERSPMLCILANALGGTLIVDKVLMQQKAFALKVNPKSLVTLADSVLNNWTLTHVIGNSGIADSDSYACASSLSK